MRLYNPLGGWLSSDADLLRMMIDGTLCDSHKIVAKFDHFEDFLIYLRFQDPSLACFVYLSVFCLHR